jgi:hypothetical protein
MRTTLDIDDDVLEAAKERARREYITAGQVVSELARATLTAGPSRTATVQESMTVYGFRTFPAGEQVVTNAEIDRLRLDDAY